MTINPIDASEVMVGATTRHVQTSGRVRSSRVRTGQGRIMGCLAQFVHVPCHVSGRVGSYLPVGRVDLLLRVFFGLGLTSFKLDRILVRNYGQYLTYELL
jgi:hypothetical protein